MNRVIERILNLLAYLLTSERPVTADDVRNTVAGYGQQSDEAFRRMFERDKDLIRQMGIPLEIQATDAYEVEFGYVVPADRYALPDPGLTDEERAALWLAAQAVRLGGQPSGPETMFKLGGAPLAAAGEPLSADLGGETYLADAFAAVLERRRVAFGYRERARVLEPYGLVHRRGHWYLVGRMAQDGEIRAFRVDRMEELAVDAVAGAFERPKGFRAADFLARAPWEAGSDEIKARVRFDADVAWWARRQLPGDVDAKESNDGGLEATLDVAHPEAFIGWILGFVDKAEILEPPELRSRLVARVRGEA